MNEKKSNNALGTAIAVLALCLVGLGFYTFQSYSGDQAYLKELKQEKAALKAELEQLLVNYEDVAIANKHLKKDFYQAKQKINRLLDSVERMEATYVLMRKYSMKVSSLKKEKQALFRMIDSLAAENESLRAKVHNNKTKLVQTVKQKKSLVAQNKILLEKVSRASQINIVQVKAGGVVVNNDMETKATNRAARAEKIEVCFTLAENGSTVPGERHFFVQIINPKNNLLGEKYSISFGEAVLNYSKTVDVFYENERVDACTLVKAEKEDLVKGRYIVNIFEGKNLLSSSRFELE